MYNKHGWNSRETISKCYLVGVKLKIIENHGSKISILIWVAIAALTKIEPTTTNQVFLLFHLFRLQHPSLTSIANNPMQKIHRITMPFVANHGQQDQLMLRYKRWGRIDKKGILIMENSKENSLTERILIFWFNKLATVLI